MHRLLLSALALSALACKPPTRPGTLVVGQIAVSEAGLAGKPEIGESAQQLRRELQQALEGTGRFVVREGGPAQVRLEIDRAQRTLAPAPMVTPGQLAPDREMAEVAIRLEATSTGSRFFFLERRSLLGTEAP